MGIAGSQRDLEAIAEYADASVRAAPKRGSLVPVSGRHGVNAWLYAKWGNDTVFTDSLVAGMYLGTIGLLVLAAVVGAVDLVRLLPSVEENGRPMTLMIRSLIAGFVVFVGFLFVIAMLRPSAAEGGRVYPEPMSPFTLRSFGVYFLALVLGVLVMARRRTMEPFLSHARGGLGITVAVLVASLVRLDRFSLGEEPWQWVYLGSYVVVLALGTAILIDHARRQPAPE